MTDTSLPDHIQTEDPAYVRNTHSKALLNTDAGALERHRRQILKARQHRGAVNEIAVLRVNQEKMEARLDYITSCLDHLIALVKRDL